MTDDRVSIGERYAKAAGSSNLKMGERRGDVDLIIAAGMARGLGTRLERLVDDFGRIDKTIKVMTPTDDPKVRRALVYLDLPGLYEIKFELLDMAMEMAERRRYAIADDIMRKIVGQCIECYLDEICPHCHGAKVTGTYGSGQPMCRPCRGEGKRSVHIGKSDAEVSFAKLLLNTMDEMRLNAMIATTANQRLVDAAKRLIEEAGQG